MFTSLRRIIAAGAGGLILLVSIIQPSFASPQEPSSYIVVGGVGTSVTTPAEREDLENVARSLGISFEQALDRFAGQEDFAAVVDAIRQSDSSTFSTANWEPGPDYKAWISFHGTPSDQGLQMISRLPFPVAVRTSSPASELSLIQAQIEARDDVAQLDGVKAADSTVEDSTGEIVVSVYIAEGYTPESVLDSAQQAANKAVRRISDAITVKVIQSDFIQ